MNRFALTVVIALAGASSLVIEILGTRILGPYYGVSLFLWSALIATALAALALGYALGGRWADRGATASKLSAALAVAGAWMFAVPWLTRPVLALAEPLGLRAAVLVGAVGLFFVPLVLIGMVGPLSIRLVARSLDEVGRIAGDVFAVSTIASVAGALATGFWLVPLVGVRGLTLLVAAALFVAGAVARVAGSRRTGRDGAAAIGLLVLAALAIASGRGLGAPDAAARAQAESAVSALTLGGRLVELVESPYAELRVVDFRNLRYLLVDGGAHTIEEIESGLSRHPYVAVAGLPRELFDRPGRLLLIGLGGGSLARDYARAGWRVDAVEIDSAVTGLARRDFGLRPFHARVVHEDGRRYLATTDSTYEVIVLDAYGSGAIPFHLVTAETFALAKRRLAQGGVLALNVEAIGWHHPLVEALGRTLRRSFPHVVALPIAEPPNRLGNLILLARESPIDIPYERLGDPVASLVDEYDHWRVVLRNHAWDNRFEPGPGSGLVLTDDRNPVDLWAESINLVARRELHALFAVDASPASRE